MSFDTTTPGTPDDRRIQPEQLDEWSISLRTTRSQLQQAIDAVGCQVVAVRAYLAGHYAPVSHGLSGHGAASVVPHMQKQVQGQSLPEP